MHSTPPPSDPATTVNRVVITMIVMPDLVLTLQLLRRICTVLLLRLWVFLGFNQESIHDTNALMYPIKISR